MNAISPVAPYTPNSNYSTEAAKSPTFSPPQSVDDLAKIPLKPLDKNFIITAAQNPQNPNTGWVKGFYASNPEGNLQSSLNQAKEYVKANYPTLDPNKVYIGAGDTSSSSSSIAAPKTVLITGPDGKVSQIGRIPNSITTGNFQPLNNDEKAVFQRLGLSSLNPELTNYNPVFNKNIDPNSRDGVQIPPNNTVNNQSNPNSTTVIPPSSPQSIAENKPANEKTNKHNDEEADSEKKQTNSDGKTRRPSLIRPLGWGESIDKKA